MRAGRRWVLVAGLATTTLLAVSPQASAITFSNTTPITIPAGAPTTTEGPANPYPSAIPVSGLKGTITKLTATLTGLSHTFVSDVGIVLSAPGGQSLEIVAGPGGSTAASNITLTLDDQAATALPEHTALSSGTFKPTSYFPVVFPYPAPAPAIYGKPGPAGSPPFATLASTFNGANPNGTWHLFVVDAGENDVGSLSGWSIDMTGPTTGERAAALKKCKKKHSKKARKKCRKKAKKLPE